MFPHGETVTRLRGTPIVSPYSGETTGTSWASPDALEIPGCGFNPGGSSQPVEPGRDAVITKPEVYAPADVDVHAGDRVVARGRTYDVEGDPAEWRNPFTGWAPGTVITLKIVEG